MSDLAVSAYPIQKVNTGDVVYVPRISLDGGQSFETIVENPGTLEEAHAGGRTKIVQRVMKGEISGWKPLTTLTTSAALLAGAAGYLITALFLAMSAGVCLMKLLATNKARADSIRKRIRVAPTAPLTID